MERYWTLKYLQQQGVRELDASVIKEGLARADSLPLVLPVLGASDLPRGARVRLKLGQIDLISLDVSGSVLHRLDAAPESTSPSEEGDSEDQTMAGPIAIAVDVTETPEEETAPAGAAGAN